MEWHFKLKFKNCNELFIKFNDGNLSQDYMSLFYKNYQRQLPILRDLGAYDIDYMRQLASKCRDVLGWNWIKDSYEDWEVTTILHKDLEKYAGHGFTSVKEEHDDLIHDLHICLHAMQNQTARPSIQLEWYNDDGFSLDPYDFNFIQDQTLGAVYLQNPYVGHPPDWIWRGNDNTDVWQTCKFHDFVRPGMIISMEGNLERTILPFNDADNYIRWWQNNAPDFLEYHGQEKMLANVGTPVIGYIINNQDLIPLQTAKHIELEYIAFNPELNLNSTVSQSTVSQVDYENIAGPDWPSYSDFLADKDVPAFVRQELANMLK